MNIKIIIATVVVGFVGVPQTGCLVVAAVGAGAGAVMYTKGDLEVTSTKSFDEVYAVVEETCKELNFEIQKNEKKAFAGRITARSDFGNVTIVKIHINQDRTCADMLMSLETGHHNLRPG